MLACMDARMDLFVMLGLARGDAHIICNAGGLVTNDALRSLCVSQRLLGTVEIVVVMHEDCGLGQRLGMSPELSDEVDEFVGLVALVAGVVEEVFGFFDEGALFGGAGDGDAAAAAEFEQTLVAELAECAEDGVGVDAENGREVFGGWESFAGLGFAVGDGAADLACDLFVQVEGVVVVELDISHSAIHYSSIPMEESP